MSQQTQHSLTFDASAVEFAVEAFGWQVHDSGYIIDEDGAVLSPRGKSVRADYCAGVVMYEGEPRPIADDFNDVVEFAVETRGDRRE